MASRRRPAPGLSPELVAAGAVSVGAVALLLAAFDEEQDATTRVLIIGAIVALGLLLLLEYQRQGQVDSVQRRRVERLAKQAEAKPDAFISALREIIPV
ncbi:MAG: hypothetical protein ACLQUY_28415 [Ktedonobacterales bacterium]